MHQHFLVKMRTGLMLADGYYATITTPSSEEGIEVVDVVRVRWIERPLLGCLTCEYTALQCSCASVTVFGSPNLGIELECIAVFVFCRVWLSFYSPSTLHCSSLALWGFCRFFCVRRSLYCFGSIYGMLRRFKIALPS